MENQNKIFKKGSKTFFYSTFFFPENVKKDITVLYAFVRVVDDFVDSVPPLKQEFYNFKNLYYEALKGNSSNYFVIDDFVILQNKYNFKQEWVDEFFSAMESDLNFQKILNLKQAEKYMHGSASVIGFMMCRILGLKEESLFYADKLGQSFQYINFIRDIAEDNNLNRQYLPQENLEKYNLENLSFEYLKNNQENFNKFLRNEIEYFNQLINEAKPGFILIPKRYRMPIQIATNLYLYTAKIIYKNPMIVFERKVKPSLTRILYEALKVIFKIK